MYRLVFMIAGVWAANHPELWGEDPDPTDIDTGECVPMKCLLGIPPTECTRLCSLRKYIPTCKNEFCLCQGLVGHTVQLISPDEVLDQPVEEVSPSFSIFAILLPISDLFEQETSSDLMPSAEPFDRVNVNEGRLLWNFRYILSGLILIMVGLVVYELLMCRRQNYYRSEPMEVKEKIVNS